jgi:MraZ protein
MADVGENVQVVAEPPHSIAQASVDDKGRLKMPSEFLDYLETLNVKKVFITTFDRRTARIYPLSVWKENERLFGAAGPNASAASRLAFQARVYGGDAEIDKSGRILVPAKLREELNLEKQPVWLEVHNDRINVMNRSVYDERLQQAMAHNAADLEALEAAGLK